MLQRFVSGLNFLKSRVVAPHVGDVPSFDSDGLIFFRTAIKQAQVYLEYGSGGSTVLAAREPRTIVCVDSDARYLRAVRNKIGPSAAVHLLHGDIGLTQNWGKPVMTRATPQRLARWQNYVNAPWHECDRLGVTPDLVLIDGRFRVASTLRSILALPGSSKTLILIDDYAGRAHYRAIEPFVEIVGMHGRMAVVRRRIALRQEDCQAAIGRYVSDFR